MGIQSKETISIIRKVYKMQLKNLQNTFTRLSGRREKILNNGWIHSVFFAGVMAVWQGLIDCVYQTGRLGWVQLPVDGARAVNQYDTMEYGSGVFLLAASGIIKMNQLKLKQIRDAYDFMQILL